MLINHNKLIRYLVLRCGISNFKTQNLFVGNGRSRDIFNNSSNSMIYASNLPFNLNRNIKYANMKFV